MIINSVIAGKGGGDEVEAYAVGDAKNAVAGDKVSLNFSKNIAPVTETFTATNLTTSGWSAFVSFVSPYALYLYTTTSSSAYSNYYAKENGVWTYKDRKQFASSSFRTKTPYGVIISGTLGSTYFSSSGWIDLDHTMSYNSLDNIAVSVGGEYLVFASSSGSSGGVVRNVVYYKENFLQELDNVIGDLSSLWWIRKEGKDYLVIGTKDANSTCALYEASPTGLKFLGTITNTVNRRYKYYMGSVGSKDSIILCNGGSYNTSFTMSVGFFVRPVLDLENMTLDLGQVDTKAMQSLLESYPLSMTNNTTVYQSGDPNVIVIGNRAFEYDEETGLFRKRYFSGEIDEPLIVNLVDNVVAACDYNNTSSADVDIYRVSLPKEQKYTASTPSYVSFLPDETLTGIVKENNNGVLTVSTVEDPNNPAPDVPDSDGLRTSINYGGGKLVNGSVVGSLTVSDDASVSGFTSSDSNFVYIDNPFLQILEGSEPVINTFEIVIPITKGTSGNDWLCALSNSASGSGQSSSVSRLAVDDSNRIVFYSTSPSLNMVGTTALSSNTKYWVKFTYGETVGYKILLSTNGSDYTVEASSATTTELNVNYPYLIFGNDLAGTSTSYNWSGTIHFDGAYVNINGRQYWKGTKIAFGSVGVSYGYFRNTLSNPSDKYVVYDGGVLTDANVFGGRATEMNVVLGRSADGGSWTSNTEGFITAQDEVVVGVNKKLSTPIYLWHDLSHITPAVPETIVPDIVMASGFKYNGTIIGSVSGVQPSLSSAEDLVATNFSDSNYLLLPENYFKNASSSFEAVVCFDSSNLSITNAALFDSPTTYTIRFTITSAGLLNFRVYTSSSSTATYTLTGTTTLSANTKYWAKITYSSSTGYELLLSTDGVSYTSEATNASTTRPYSSASGALRMGDNNTSGSSLAGKIYLSECYININGSRVWDGVVHDSGTVSLPIAWKNINGALYEYPDGFPVTQASALSANTVEGANNLYATRTGNTCGMAISSDLSNSVATLNGDLSVSGDNISGFMAEAADQRYIVVHHGNVAGQYPFEVVLCFTYTASTADQDIAGAGSIRVRAASDGSYTARINVANGYYDRVEGATLLQEGVKYWLKLSKESWGGPVQLSLSTDGSAYSVENTLSSSSANQITSESFRLGMGTDLWKAFKGTIHLGDCYVSAGGVIKFAGDIVDSSAVIGTVELDANGAITSYTPGE